MTSITKELIGESYNNIYTFNDIAGNLSGDMVEKVDQQLSFIFEELTEAIEGLETRDAKELLDGAVDVWVTAAGLLQKLEAAGFDVAGAIAKIDANNLSKFPACGQALQFDVGLSVNKNEKYQRYVLKNSAGKVCKPHGFQKVDLSACVPVNFFV